MLNVLRYGDPALPHLMIVHGLFGSARNWGVIAKRLSDKYHVICPDLRNHGDSPWYDTHSYFDLAGDLAELIDAPIDLLGHSMGGKAAMVLALTQPEKVKRLLVADIAPVTYSHTQLHNIEAMKAVDLSQVKRRSDAAPQLNVSDDVRAFFLQSLDVGAKKWKLNLDVLARDMDKIIGFPDLSSEYDGPTLFLSGGQSDYVTSEHRTEIKRLFPNARFAKIPDASHWLHADKPRDFEKTLRIFFQV